MVKNEQYPIEDKNYKKNNIAETNRENKGKQQPEKEKKRNDIHDGNTYNRHRKHTRERCD